MLSKNDEVMKYSDQGIQLARQLNNKIFEADFIGIQTEIYKLEGEEIKALELINLALNLANETDDERIKAQTLAARASIYRSIEDYQNAINDLQIALDVFKKHNDRMRLSVYYNSLAIINSNIGEFGNAIQYLQESNKFDDYKSDYDLSVFHYNLGFFYLQTNQQKQGIENLLLSKEYSIKSNDEDSVAHVDYVMAEIYYEDGEYGKSNELLESCLEYFRKQNSVQMHFNSALLMSEVKLELEDQKSSALFLEEAKMVFKKNELKSNHLKLLLAKLKFFEMQEQWKEALKTSKDIRTIELELNEKEKQASINEVKVKFDAQFDQEKLKILEQENKIQQAAIEQENTYYLIVTALMFLLFLLLILIYWAYRQQSKAKEALQKITFLDDLTQISNRRHILKKLKFYLKNSSKRILDIAVVMIDLDFFKKINDTYGHLKGNDVLVHFANVSKKLLKDQGQIGRLGGEEWLILLPGFDQVSTQQFLKNLRKHYNQLEDLKLTKTENITFSSGVFTQIPNHLRVSEILKISDDALYEAKRNGRNQDKFVTYDSQS